MKINSIFCEFITFLFLLHMAVMSKPNLSPLALTKDTEIQWNCHSWSTHICNWALFYPPGKLLGSLSKCYFFSLGLLFFVVLVFFLSPNISQKVIAVHFRRPWGPWAALNLRDPRAPSQRYSGWLQRGFHPPLKHIQRWKGTNFHDSKIKHKTGPSGSQ